MSKEIKLPEYLFPYKTDNLIRIGQSSDGSYLVDKDSVLDSDLLISIGVGTIFEFERRFLELNKVPILAFDGSAGLSSQYKKIKWRIRQILKTRNKKYFIESFQHFFAPFKFYFFFKNFRSSSLNNNYRRFVKQYVGKDESYISFDDIFRNYNLTDKFNKIFFQIDIEGGEYSILDELIKHQDKIIGLVIEFHNVDKYFKQIENFIELFNLNLVHNHINNIGGVSSENYPKVIELTFSNCIVQNRVTSLPHSLDEPNSDDLFDYVAYLN